MMQAEFEALIGKEIDYAMYAELVEPVYILSMYAKGMTTGDIEVHIQDIYGVSVSDSAVSRITDKTTGAAAATAGGHLRRSVSGRHPLPCPQRGPDRKEDGIHRYWH